MIKRSEKDVIGLYRKLMNESQVAKELGVSRQSMYDYRIRHNIPYDPNTAKEKTYDTLYKDRNEKIIRFYLSGIPMEKICKKFSMKKPAINYILLKAKVKKPVFHPSHERNMTILRLRKRGISIIALAKKYKMDPQYISSMIYKLKRKQKEKCQGVDHEKG